MFMDIIAAMFSGHRYIYIFYISDMFMDIIAAMFSVGVDPQGPSNNWAETNCCWIPQYVGSFVYLEFLPCFKSVHKVHYFL